MNHNIILFISGKAYSGKDTIYKTLILMKKFLSYTPKVNQLGIINGMTNSLSDQDIIKFAFADEVKKEVCIKYPHINLERLLSDETYKSGFRRELIEIGHGFRQDNPLCWIEKLDTTISEQLPNLTNKILCVTDTRYYNELSYADNFMSKFGFNNICFKIKIEADLTTRLNRMPILNIPTYLEYGQHNPGEMETDSYKDYDKVINNNQNFDSYREIFEHLSKQLKDIFEIYVKLKELK